MEHSEVTFAMRFEAFARDDQSPLAGRSPDTSPSNATAIHAREKAKANPKSPPNRGKRGAAAQMLRFCFECYP